MIESTAAPVKTKSFVVYRLPQLVSLYRVSRNSRAHFSPSQTLVDHLAKVLLAELELTDKGHQQGYVMDREVEKLVEGIIAVFRVSLLLLRLFPLANPPSRSPSPMPA